jgi:hypothetical protein
MEIWWRLMSIPPEKIPQPFVLSYSAPPPRGRVPGTLVDFAAWAFFSSLILLAVEATVVAVLGNDDSAGLMCCVGFAIAGIIAGAGVLVAAVTRECRYLLLGQEAKSRSSRAHIRAGICHAVGTIGGAHAVAAINNESLSEAPGFPLTLLPMALSAIIAGWFLVKRQRTVSKSSSP